MEPGRTLHALADGTRRDILGMLRVRPHTVGDLASALPVSQPAVSQHLKVLREAGLVAVEKEGVRRIYQLRIEGLRSLRSYVESFWDEALGAFRSSFDASD
jgi:DNA-binding transcriptional ArsR family regulator